MTLSAKKSVKLQGRQTFRWLEGILLVVVLAVMALRLSFIETPQNMMQNIMLPTTPRGISLLLSATIFIAAIIGLLLRVLQGRWSFNRIIIAGWALFAIAGVFAVHFSSDKRVAMTACFSLIVPMLTVLIMPSWLDSTRRIDVVLWVILAMGCAAVYVSADQYFDSNQKVIEDYERDPLRHLQTLGIEPNSLAQFQYEHRIHSKDIRGFLTTSNSTGTFLLACIFVAAGLLADTIRRRHNDPGFSSRLIVLILVMITLAGGLCLGNSRGAIAAAGLSMILFVTLIALGRQFWHYRRSILAVLLLLFLMVWAVIIFYGMKHGKLPGPNAMYVRWQYWVSAAQMAAQHPFGVGGGNFGIFFPQYKIPAAPESVLDPHNVVLSIVCQFGIAGLLGFILVIFAALWQGLKGTFETPVQPTSFDKQDKIIPFGTLVAVTLTLLILRPVASEGGVLGESSVVRQAVFLVLYLLPAVFFVCPFGFLWATGKEISDDSSRSGLVTGLICAAVGILIHNLIDFAIFEPGVWTTFWILIALILSLHSSLRLSMPASKHMRVLLSILFFAATVATLYIHVWIPVRAAGQFQMALQHDNPVSYFQSAARIDPFDPDPLQYEARFYLARHKALSGKNESDLSQAVVSAQQAIQSDRYDFAQYELLYNVYLTQSETQEDPNTALDSAYQTLLEAWRFYPGCDRIVYNLGLLAEKLNQPQKAVEYFRRAVEIEDQYRRQFAEMYPGYSLCSRLGEKRYEYAKNYILKTGYQ